jgi:hypothetical protein
LGEFSLIVGFLYFENQRCSPHFWATFFHGLGYALNFTKNGLGYILGDLFINSSGHPFGENEI